MDIKFKKRSALIKEFNKIQISRRDLMTIKKMQIENERKKIMKSKNNKVNVPVNVLAEPVFNSEIEAYEYYAEKYDIEKIKEYVEAYTKFKAIPKLASKQTDADKVAKSDYTTLQKDLGNEIKENGLKNEYIEKFNVDVAEYPDEKKLLSILAQHYMEDCCNIYNEFKQKVTNAINTIPLIVAIDTGKSNTKYAYRKFDVETGQFEKYVITDSFPSRVSEVETSSVTGMSTELIVNGVSYIVASPEAEKVCSSDNVHTTGKTKAHEYHKVLKVEALRRICDETGRNSFNAVIGCSLDSHLADKGATVYFTMINYELPDEDYYTEDANGNTVEREYYEVQDIAKERMNELMESFEGLQYDISYGDKDYTIHINDILICPETIASAMAFGDIEFDSEEYYNTFIIDIGGLNRTVVAYVGGALEDHSIDEYGMAYMTSRARAYLNNHTGDYRTEKFDFAYIQKVLKFYELKDKTQPIDNYLYHYFDELTQGLRDLEKVSFNPDMSKLIFVGGTTQSIQDFIKHYYKEELDLAYPIDIAEDGLVSNVIGMFNFGEHRFVSRSKRRQKTVA